MAGGGANECLLDADTRPLPKIHIKTDLPISTTHNKTYTRLLFYIQKNLLFSICLTIAFFITIYLNCTSPQLPQATSLRDTHLQHQDKLRANPSFEPDHILPWDTAVANSSTKVKAAFVVMACEEDLYKLHATMLDIERHFNQDAGYPWVILGHQVFSRQFREWITNTSKGAPVFFGLVPAIEWQEPYWIDHRKYEESVKNMAKDDLSRGESMHWRRMTRYNAGFLAFHPLLKDLEFYWKVQPGSLYHCDTQGDPFKRMKEGGKKLSFALSMTENHLFIQDFDPTVKAFIRSHKEKLVPVKYSIYKSLLNDHSLRDPNKYQKEDPSLGDWAGAYSNCMINNNFMIISLDFLRSKEYNLYFDELDVTGGFFYQRWGDSFPQTFAAALLLKKDEISYNDVVGYEYGFGAVCPSDIQDHVDLKCTCNPPLYKLREMDHCTHKIIKSIQGNL